jgi:protocatechuate 3,4-dioxygenase beta subunit
VGHDRTTGHRKEHFVSTLQRFLATRQAAHDLPTYEGRQLANPEEEVFDQGLAFDLETLMVRRQVLRLIGVASTGTGLLALVACLPSAGSPSTAASGPSSSATSSAASSSGTASCETIPEETAGPFPGDGSNGPDVLSQSGVVRSDIRSSFGNASGVAQGIPLSIKLTIQDQGNSCAPLAGAAVYLWHCDRDGNYSLYSQGVTNQNYLRGVQETNSAGLVTFQSIFPACYSGRWPHIHFEVYPSLENAGSAANKIATSQIALPKDTCDQVYATDGYSQSVRNLGQTSLQTDNVFGNDAGVRQLGAVSGSLDAGLVVALTVPVKA